jgi:galactofuranose transport system permease protein
MSAWHKLKWPLVALGVILLFNAVFPPESTPTHSQPGFFHITVRDGRLYGSVIDILNRAAPVMLLSLGMTLVIATGGVDLSVGAVMAITGAVAAQLLTKGAAGVAVVVVASLGVSILAGIWNGTLVGIFKVPPIVATLILMVSGRGIAQLLTDGQIITFENKSFEFIGRGSVAGLPFTILLVLALWAVLSLLKSRTALGLFIECTGDNETASRYSGVNTNLVKLVAYSICSLCAGLAGLIAATDIKAADANNAGLWLELDAILATVIGGTALTGGRFFLAGSLIGALLIQTLTTTILTWGVAVELTLVVKAVVVILVCLLQSEKFRQVVWKRKVAVG